MLPDWLVPYLKSADPREEGIAKLREFAYPPITISGCTLDHEETVRLVWGLHTAHDKLLPQLATESDLDWELFVLYLFYCWRAAGMFRGGGWLVPLLGKIGGERTLPHLIAFHRETVKNNTQTQASAFAIAQLKLPLGDLCIAGLWVRSILYPDLLKLLQRDKKSQVFLIELAAEIPLIRPILHYGQRDIELMLDTDFRLWVKGARREDHLPAPTPDDDPQAVRLAQQMWEEYQQWFTDLRGVLAYSLEAALLDEHRWTLPQFRAHFLAHTLAGRFAQSLVWGIFNSDNRLVQTFRIAEDFTLADEQDRHFELPTTEIIHLGLVHPLYLDDTLRGRWQTLLFDYDILQPFPQLQRQVYALLPTDIPQDGTASIKRKSPSTYYWYQPKGLIFRLHWQFPRFGSGMSRKFAQGYQVKLVRYYDGTIVFESTLSNQLPVLHSIPPVVISEALYFWHLLEQELAEYLPIDDPY